MRKHCHHCGMMTEHHVDGLSMPRCKKCGGLAHTSHKDLKVHIGHTPKYDYKIKVHHARGL